MKKLLFLGLLVSYSNSWGQSFSQINQTPLLYHPSFAGSTGKGRLAWMGNMDNYNMKSSYLSYDNLWKEKGIGWGTSLLYSHQSSDGSFDMKNNRIGANCYFSTKHVLLYSIDEKPKYTLSPSLSLGYTFDRTSYDTDYLYYGNDKIILDHQTWQATLGMLVNSENGYVGITYKNSLRVDDLKYAAYFEAQNYHHTAFLPSFSLVLAQTFFSRSKFFRLTPSGYFQLNTVYKKSGNYSYSTTKDVTLNLTANIMKIYLGAGYSSFLISNRNVFAGFQNEHIRMGGGYGWNTDYADIKFYELSFSRFF